MVLIADLVYSVQAIGLSTEVAHNLGFSELNAVLLGSAVRIAQCPGLHKITHEPVVSHQSGRERVDIELGIRVWCQMIVQDLFAILFNGSHGNFPHQYFLSLDVCQRSMTYSNTPSSLLNRLADELR